MAHISHYTKGLILLGVINLLVVLLIFFSPNNNLFTNENAMTILQNKNAITGMAVSGFTEATESSPALKEILINPKTGKVLTGNPFTVDIVAYPKGDATKTVKYYLIKLRFDSSKISYTSGSAKSLIQAKGWTVSESVSGSTTTTKTLTIEGTAASSGFSASQSAPLSLVEFGFTAASGITADTSTSLLFFTYSLKDAKDGTSISGAITKKTSSTITITAPVIIDNDGDGYSPPEDCDDDTSDDGYYPSLCPDTIAECYEEISVATIPIKYQINLPLLESTGTVNIVSQKNKFCSICRNPGIDIDYCDGIDNDCDGVVDGKTTMYENCPSGVCAATSCPESPTDTTSCAETEQKLGICIALLPTCNINECPNTLSVGGTSAGCDEKGICTTVGENCVDKGSTIDFTIIGGKTISYPTQTCNTAGTHKLIYFCKSSTTGAVTNMGMQKVSCLLGCSNGECVTSCPVSSSCPTCPTEKEKKVKVNKELTPACGDGSCQVFENYLTCKEDCKKEDICDSTKGGNTNYCLIDTNNDGAYDNDLDNDELPNEYEVYLEFNVPQQIKSQANYKGWYDMNLPDTDIDGVLDGDDYCPGTDTKGDAITTKTGRVNALGCYVTDVGSGNKQQLRPDGCFSGFDTTYYIAYYTNTMKGDSCINLLGEKVVK